MDLGTTYLGLQLRNPIVPSASPLSEDVGTIKQMEDAGAGAVVMHSLFEEQITYESRTLDHYLSYFTEAYAEALTYFPEPENYQIGPERYLEKIRKAKEACAIPIIASLNGVSTGGWISYAREMEQAGADALELNIYYIPTDARLSGAEVEQMYLEVVRDVRRSISIPLAVKLNPFFSAPANMAVRLTEAGANGLVLFNRFYQPDLDIEALEVTPHLVLSNSNELRLPLRWIAMLYGQVPADLALTTGVHTPEDAIKGIMAGASVTMAASSLLRHGIAHITTLVNGVHDWMEAHEYSSVMQMRGSMSRLNVAEPTAFERANYVKTLQSYRPDPVGRLIH